MPESRDRLADDLGQALGVERFQREMRRKARLHHPQNLPATEIRPFGRSHERSAVVSASAHPGFATLTAATP